jgi:hypothetical protein
MQPGEGKCDADFNSIFINFLFFNWMKCYILKHVYIAKYNQESGIIG